VSIGERIIELRSELGITQTQLASLLEVSRQAVSKWENGQSVPDSSRMIQLAELLKTDIEYLTTGRSVVPTRPPVVLETVKTIEKVVEKPIIQVVEKIVERKVEVPVEVPVVEYVDRPVVKYKVRTRYIRNPLEFAVFGGAAFVIGFLIGFLL
jgi:transcriptional regulator with XRE-family HTH domain